MNKYLLVITGGTKGIGKAIIKSFAETGKFDIVTCSRSENDLENLKKEIERQYNGTTLYTQQADLSKKADCEQFIHFTKSLDREVEVLVNNSGIFIPGTVHEEPEGNLEMMIETNLYSAYRITRGIVPTMKARQGGHVFNICSTASITAYVNGGSYCISKFAMYGMNKVLREEMKEQNVRVTAIIPGATFTASWEGVDIPPERFMKPEDVASAVLNAYQMSANSVVEEILIRPQLGDL